MKLAARVILVVLLTAGLLALWLRGIDVGAMTAAAADARPVLVAGVVAASLVHLAVRTGRWQAILVQGGSADPVPPLRRLFTFTTLGYTVSFTVPGRLGELVRPALLWREGPVPAGAALASIVLERLLDVLVLLVLLLLGLLALDGAGHAGLVRGAAWGLAGLVAAAAAGLVVLHRRERLERLIGALARRAPARMAPALERTALSFVEAFAALRRPGAWWRLSLWSAATWAPVLAAMALALAATRVDAPPAAALVLVPLSALGIAVPTPAGVGAYHAVLTWGLVELYGVDSGRAAAAAVVAHAASVVPVIALGLVLLWREGLSWRRLVEVAR